MKNELVKFEAPELLAIEKSKAKQIKDTFEPMVKMLETFEDRYKELMSIPLEEITPEQCQEYKRFRLDVSKVRIKTGEAKDKAKENLKLEDKAIMAVHNLLVWAVKDMEDNSKERETIYETKEKLRLENLQIERANELSKYVADAHERRLSDMEDDVWNAYLSAKKKEYEDRIEAEKQAELKRLETERIGKLHNERKEIAIPYYSFWSDFEKTLNFGEVSDSDFNAFIERIKNAKKEHDANIEKQEKENERLKKEAEDKEKALEKERQKAKAEADKLKAENEAKLKKEQEAKAKLEAELKAKKEAEIKAENERRQAELKAKAEAEKLAKAPIKHQLNQWVSSFEIPLFTIENDKASEIVSKFEAFKSWAKKEIESI